MGEVKGPHAKLTVAHTIFRLPPAARRGLLFIYTANVNSYARLLETMKVMITRSMTSPWSHLLEIRHTASEQTTTIFGLTEIAAGRLRLGDSRHNCIYSGGASAQKCLKLDHSI